MNILEAKNSLYLQIHLHKIDIKKETESIKKYIRYLSTQNPTLYL